MKKVFVVLLIVFLLLTMLGCSASDSPSPEYTNITFNTICEVFHHETYSGHLCVDSITGIVYLHSAGHSLSGITPYLAPNGQPYTYDEATLSLIPLPSYQNEEIPEEWIIKLANKE